MPKKTTTPEDLGDKLDRLEIGLDQLQERVHELEDTTSQLTDAVQLLTWAICELGGIWLPTALTPQDQDTTPSQAAQALRARQTELRCQARPRGELEKLLEDQSK